MLMVISPPTTVAHHSSVIAPAEKAPLIQPHVASANASIPSTKKLCDCFIMSNIRCLPYYQSEPNTSRPEAHAIMPPMPPSTMAPITTHKTKVTPTSCALELPPSLPASQIRTPTASSAPITIRNVPTSQPTPSPSSPIHGAE